VAAGGGGRGSSTSSRPRRSWRRELNLRPAAEAVAEGARLWTGAEARAAEGARPPTGRGGDGGAGSSASGRLQRCGGGARFGRWHGEPELQAMGDEERAREGKRKDPLKG
jgi:hypothetical protein